MTCECLIEVVDSHAMFTCYSYDSSTVYMTSFSCRLFVVSMTFKRLTRDI